jgi:hypothetical protein
MQGHRSRAIRLGRTPYRWFEANEALIRQRFFKQAIVPGVDGMFVAELTVKDQRKRS